MNKFRDYVASLLNCANFRMKPDPGDCPTDDQVGESIMHKPEPATLRSLFGNKIKSKE